MTDEEEASVQENVEPTAPVPQETLPTALQPADNTSVAETPADGATTTSGEIVDGAAAGGPVSAGAGMGLTEDLRELRDSIVEPTASGESTGAETSGGDAAAQPTDVMEPVVEVGEPGESAETEEPEMSECSADEGSLDDIAPGTVAAGPGPRPTAPASPVPLAVAPITSVSWWPFVGYIVVWLGVAGYAVWRLEQLPAGRAAYETELYSMSVLVGLSLLVAGPFLLLIVWFASWIGRKGARVGSMFISALAKGAVATLLGAIIWIGAIMLIDYLRLGHPY